MPRQTTLEEKPPELFAKDQYTDPGKRERVVLIEVLCLGDMRTGKACRYSRVDSPLRLCITDSGSAQRCRMAFNTLGLPGCHWFSLYNHIRDCDMWIRAFDAKYARKGEPFTRTECDQLRAEYGAVTDVPALAFWEDLMSAYPEAKVVLMERDIERWYRSFDDAVAKVMWGRLSNLLADYERGFVGPLRDVHRRWATDWMGVHSADEMRKAAKDRYRKYYASVRRIVPKERLLEYRLGNGWEPLCAFLEKSMSDVEFPNIDETASMHENIAIITRRGL
ncbi:MAG: hypothetical protein Q9184_003951 [Pyrenodesmia sp. 2 TL-2023]